MSRRRHFTGISGSYKLFPQEKFAGFTPPPQSIPKSIGHYAEWIQACREGTPTTCNFGAPPGRSPRPMP